MDGSLTIDGGSSTDPITELCNLNALTEITGTLKITNFNKTGNPDNLDDLAALTKLGCNLNIISNPELKTISLNSLTTVGCALFITDNVNVEIISMSLLGSLSGEKLWIKNNSKAKIIRLSDSAPSFSFVGKGSSVDVSGNGSSTSDSLTMSMKKIKVIKGPLVFSNNDNKGVSNFDSIFSGLTNISTSYGNLTITGNDYLAKCCIAATTVVAGTRTINGNTGKCADINAVVNDCGPLKKSKDIEPWVTSDGLIWSVYPTPNKGKFNVELITAETGNVHVSVIDLTGRIVFSHAQVLSGDVIIPVNLEFAAKGHYFVKVEMNGQMWVKKVVLVE